MHIRRNHRIADKTCPGGFVIQRDSHAVIAIFFALISLDRKNIGLTVIIEVKCKCLGHVKSDSIACRHAFSHRSEQFLLLRAQYCKSHDLVILNKIECDPVIAERPDVVLVLIFTENIFKHVIGNIGIRLFLPFCKKFREKIRVGNNFRQCQLTSGLTVHSVGRQTHLIMLSACQRCLFIVAEDTGVCSDRHRRKIQFIRCEIILVIRVRVFRLIKQLIKCIFADSYCIIRQRFETGSKFLILFPVILSECQILDSRTQVGYILSGIILIVINRHPLN